MCVSPIVVGAFVGARARRHEVGEAIFCRGGPDGEVAFLIFGSLSVALRTFYVFDLSEFFANDFDIHFLEVFGSEFTAEFVPFSVGHVVEHPFGVAFPAALFGGFR